MNKGPPKFPTYLSNNGLNVTQLKKDMKGKTVKELRDMYFSIVPEYETAIIQAKGTYQKRLHNVLIKIQKLFDTKLFAKAKWALVKDTYTAAHVKDTYTAAQCDIFDKKYEDYLIYLESILNKTIADNNWRTPEIIHAIADEAYKHCQKRLEILLQNNAGKYKYESKHINWGLKNILDAVNIYREKEGKDTYNLYGPKKVGWGEDAVSKYAYGTTKPKEEKMKSHTHMKGNPVPYFKTSHRNLKF